MAFSPSSDNSPSSIEGRWIELTAADRHSFDAFEAAPPAPIGGVVVLQEIFGVNGHIQAVCRRFAVAGYHAVAPAIFDRQERGFQSGYSPDEIAAARRFLNPVNWDGIALDLAAAADYLHGLGLKVAAVGFCLGGSAAYRAAVAGSVEAAISYYGGQIAPIADWTPLKPTLLHFGRMDPTIPMADVERIAAQQPDLPLYVYEAGHGFNCDARESFEPESACIAWERSLDFLKQHLV